jgi:hypothetical protein
MQEVDSLERDTRHLRLNAVRSGFVTSYNRQTEEITGVTRTGAFRGQLPPIFESAGAYIRGGYSPQGVWVAYNQDQAQPIIIAQHTSSADKQLAQYDAGTGYYRPLEPGAIDIKSSGMAGMYADTGGTLELRGGLVQGLLSQELMAIEWHAPAHRRFLHTANEYLGGDQEVFGTVMRHLNPLDPLPQPVPDPTNPTTFAKEYSRTLSGLLTPAVLVREGTLLMDDMGVPMLSSMGVPLRAAHRYGSTGVGTSGWDVDQLGNMDLYTGIEAVTGITVKVPTGFFNVTAGLGVTLKSPVSVSLMAPTVTATAEASMSLASPGTIAIGATGSLNLAGTGLATLSSGSLLSLSAPLITLGPTPNYVGIVTEATPCPYLTSLGLTPPANLHGATMLCTKTVRVSML